MFYYRKHKFEDGKQAKAWVRENSEKIMSWLYAAKNASEAAA